MRGNRRDGIFIQFVFSLMMLYVVFVAGVDNAKVWQIEGCPHDIVIQDTPLQRKFEQGNSPNSIALLSIWNVQFGDKTCNRHQHEQLHSSYPLTCPHSFRNIFKFKTLQANTSYVASFRPSVCIPH